MKIWSTKYALTLGIQELEGEITNVSDRMFAPVKQPGTFQGYIFKPYWHETPEAAIRHAKDIAQRKVSSLEKSIVKIKEIDWTAQVEKLREGKR